MTDSPVNTLLKSLIHFDKSSASPVYIQISQQIINAIQRSYLAGGSLLPGTRIFSQLINVHRNTAVAVYDELASQGWVEIIANKGTFISVPEQRTATIKAGSNQLGDIYNFAETTGFPFQPSFHLSSTQEFSEAKYELNDGQPDLRLHPIHEFSKWYGASMKRKSLISKWNQNKKTRYSVFENQLCNYLKRYKGTSHKTKKRHQHKKYRNEFVHHIATFNSPKRCGFGWGFEQLCCQHDFSTIGRHYQNNPY